MKSVDALIFSRLVHHLNFGLGAGYPLPIKQTQYLAKTSGCNILASMGIFCCSAAILS
jgi:hypothetical protein